LEADGRKIADTRKGCEQISDAIAEVGTQGNETRGHAWIIAKRPAYQRRLDKLRID